MHPKAVRWQQQHSPGQGEGFPLPSPPPHPGKPQPAFQGCLDVHSNGPNQGRQRDMPCCFQEKQGFLRAIWIEAQVLLCCQAHSTKLLLGVGGCRWHDERGRNQHEQVLSLSTSSTNQLGWRMNVLLSVLSLPAFLVCICVANWVSSVVFSSKLGFPLLKHVRKGLRASMRGRLAIQPMLVFQG